MGPSVACRNRPAGSRIDDYVHLNNLFLISRLEPPVQPIIAWRLEQARKKMIEITADDLATAYTGSTVTVIVEFADSERIEITRGVMKGDAPGRAG